VPRHRGAVGLAIDPARSKATGTGVGRQGPPSRAPLGAALFAVEVLYVLKGVHRIRKLADPELVLEAGDHMVVMSEASSLQAFRERIRVGAADQGGALHPAETDR